MLLRRKIIFDIGNPGKTVLLLLLQHEKLGALHLAGGFPASPKVGPGRTLGGLAGGFLASVTGPGALAL